MTTAQFCEREYEVNFNSQVPTVHGCIWSPGQVYEHFLGFDAAYLSLPQLIFRLFPASPRRGVRLSPADWQEYVQFIDDQFPPFKFNLFVQHKRPEFIRSVLGKEYDQWQHPYYRYDIDHNQQTRLERLETIAGDHALVTYACAAFHTYRELWQHAVKSTLIESSNFIRPAALVGHHRYSFDRAGKSGRATSEPTPVEGQDFTERFREHLAADDRFTLPEIIMAAGNIIQETIRGSVVPDQLFERIISDVTERLLGENPVLHSYITVQAFCFLNRTSWSLVAQAPEEADG